MLVTDGVAVCARLPNGVAPNVSQPPPPNRPPALAKLHVKPRMQVYQPAGINQVTFTCLACLASNITSQNTPANLTPRRMRCWASQVLLRMGMIVAGVAEAARGTGTAKRDARTSRYSVSTSYDRSWTASTTAEARAPTAAAGTGHGAAAVSTPGISSCALGSRPIAACTAWTAATSSQGCPTTSCQPAPKTAGPPSSSRRSHFRQQAAHWQCRPKWKCAAGTTPKWCTVGA